ncbi:MAG TPA: hypothetical protein PK425_08560 [Syntrophales bacterium]|nr:hypothetical protein [Syntrophales bacterium]HPX56575.1 hypothetical protein [Syntrophales bacterium]
MEQDQRRTNKKVRTLSESDHRKDEEKGEFRFFIGEEDKLKTRLDLFETDQKSGDKELSRFFLGNENNVKDHSDHK